MPDPYEGIDFEEISEATGLAVDEIKCLKVTIRKHFLLKQLLLRLFLLRDWTRHDKYLLAIADTERILFTSLKYFPDVILKTVASSDLRNKLFSPGLLRSL